MKPRSRQRNANSKLQAKLPGKSSEIVISRRTFLGFLGLGTLALGGWAITKLLHNEKGHLDIENSTPDQLFKEIFQYVKSEGPATRQLRETIGYNDKTGIAENLVAARIDPMGQFQITDSRYQGLTQFNDPNKCLIVFVDANTQVPNYGRWGDLEYGALYHVYETPDGLKQPTMFIDSSSGHAIEVAAAIGHEMKHFSQTQRGDDFGDLTALEYEAYSWEVAFLQEIDPNFSQFIGNFTSWVIETEGVERTALAINALYAYEMPKEAYSDALASLGMPLHDDFREFDIYGDNYGRTVLPVINIALNFALVDELQSRRLLNDSPERVKLGLLGSYLDYLAIPEAEFDR